MKDRKKGGRKDNEFEAEQHGRVNADGELDLTRWRNRGEVVDAFLPCACPWHEG